MSPFFDDLEDQLRGAARARTEGEAAGGSPEPGRSSRRSRWAWLRAGARGIPVAVAVATTVVIVVAALVFLGHGRRPNASPPTTQPSHRGPSLFSGGTPTPQLRRELAYIGAATKHVQGSAACATAQLIAAPPIHGTPGHALRSALGVLRRPATAADRLGSQFSETNMRLFAGGARRALVAGGVSYFVVPGRQDPASEFPSDRCFTLQAAALRQILPTIPASLRAPTLALQAQVLGYVRRLKASPPQDVICFVSRSGNAISDSCGETASQIVHGQLPGDDMGTFSGIVPDGVASVTLRFPAPTGHPARSVTAPVTNNVYATRLAGPGPAVTVPRPSMVWRSAGGRVLKTITEPTAAAVARLCQRQPLPCVLGYGLTSSGGGSSSSASSSSSSASASASASGTATAPRAAP